MATARRVTVIAHELRGFRPVGGMGTATTLLALALARLGHSVEILLGKHDLRSIDPRWSDVYANAGVGLRAVPPSEGPVEPWEFAHAHQVLLALRDDPPDVVIAHDFGAPAYSALRVRQTGLGFDETVFVIFCHGPRRYVVDLAPELALGDLRAVLGVSILEQAAVELADVVVSPSAFLLDWMREQGWSLPASSRVIPYFTQASATGEPVAEARRPSPDRLRRLTFFGRTDEKKGLKVFASALERLEPALLGGVEVEVVGKPTGSWPRERVEALLPRALVTGELEQDQAFELLSRPGTLVVMPSLQENSPNAVYECLERRIPFVASNVGGVRELIAPRDRERILFEPTAEALEAMLRAVLTDGKVPAPARAAVGADDSLERWREVIDTRSARSSAPQSDGNEYVLVPDAEADLRDVLLQAQRATGADVVTCGLRLADGRIRLFAGDPGGLGALANGYGTVALVRRDLLDTVPTAWPEERDTAWPMLAGLAASGATVVSIPLPLAESDDEPGAVENDPAAALRAAQQLERSLPGPLAGSARLAAGLAADDRRDNVR